MVGANVPGRVGVSLCKRSHPFFAMQFTPEKCAHFLLLHWREILRHIVDDREKVIAVSNFVERSVRLAATPISLAIDVKQAIDPFRQIGCLGTDRKSTR